MLQELDINTEGGHLSEILKIDEDRWNDLLTQANDLFSECESGVGIGDVIKISRSVAGDDQEYTALLIHTAINWNKMVMLKQTQDGS